LKGASHHHPPIFSFAPDSRTLISASSDETIRVWDPATGRQLRELSHPITPAPAHWFGSLRVLPDNNTAFVFENGSLRFFELQTGKKLLRIDENKETRKQGNEKLPSRDFDLSADLRVRVTFCTHDGTPGQPSLVQILDRANGKERARYPPPATWSGAFSPDLQMVAAMVRFTGDKTGAPPQTVVKEATTGRELLVISQRDVDNWPETFSPDSQTLFTKSGRM
jgi:WD40 repeat protein